MTRSQAGLEGEHVCPLGVMYYVCVTNFCVKICIDQQELKEFISLTKKNPVNKTKNFILYIRHIQIVGHSLKYEGGVVILKV